ncbi:hypothetical protein B0I35DRAFT_247396 [Stachybotrys elegans]|uniref:Telomeric single stranded DNA binding POT1/Cdc13 domain-containing protein n=1 Tax=Stachybotrys elegans TaxID=80388 RepID=A0A8K0SRN2_9HYPO|nr:hypothetical protein B0I35DRAFT_247396 [Stachybotrys elegans]
MDGDAVRVARPTPIPQLKPDLPDLPDATTNVIEGTVTVTWPFSIVNKSVAFILAESDVLLRRNKGQLRVEFCGAAGKAVSAAAIGGGDAVKLSLVGGAWAAANGPTRPDTLEWQLTFSNHLVLLLRKADNPDAEEIIDINSTDEAEVTIAPPAEVAAELSSLTPPEPTTPRPLTPSLSFPSKRLASATFDGEEYSSPAFLKRARVSYGSLFEGGIDAIEQDTGRALRKKRSRFSMGAGAWRYSSRSPTPERADEAEKGSAEDDDSDHEAAQEPTATPKTPAPRLMVDEGCQTHGLDFSPSMGVQISAEPRAPAVPSASPTPVASTRLQYGETANEGSLPDADQNEPQHPSDMISSPDKSNAHDGPNIVDNFAFGMPDPQHDMYHMPMPHDYTPNIVEPLTTGPLEDMHGIQSAYPTSIGHDGLDGDVLHIDPSLQFHSAIDEPHNTGFNVPQVDDNAFYSVPERMEQASWLPANGDVSTQLGSAEDGTRTAVEIIDSSSPARELSPAPDAIDAAPESERGDLVENTAGRSQDERSPDSADGAEYEDGGDEPGEDYDLRNYDPAHDDDDDEMEVDGEAASHVDEDDVEAKPILLSSQGIVEAVLSESEEELLAAQEIEAGVEEAEEANDGEVKEDDVERASDQSGEEYEEEYEKEEVGVADEIRARGKYDYDEGEDVDGDNEEEEDDGDEDDGEDDEDDVGEYGEEDGEEYDEEEEELEEDYEEDYEEGEEEEEEEEVAPPVRKPMAPKEPVFISLLSDSEDEPDKEEEKRPAEPPRPPPKSLPQFNGAGDDMEEEVEDDRHTEAEERDPGEDDEEEPAEEHRLASKVEERTKDIPAIEEESAKGDTDGDKSVASPKAHPSDSPAPAPEAIETDKTHENPDISVSIPSNEPQQPISSPKVPSEEQQNTQASITIPEQASDTQLDEPEPTDAMDIDTAPKDGAVSADTLHRDSVVPTDQQQSQDEAMEVEEEVTVEQETTTVTEHIEVTDAIVSTDTVMDTDESRATPIAVVAVEADIVMETVKEMSDVDKPSPSENVSADEMAMVVDAPTPPFTQALETGKSHTVEELSIVKEHTTILDEETAPQLLTPLATQQNNEASAEGSAMAELEADDDMLSGPEEQIMAEYLQASSQLQSLDPAGGETAPAQRQATPEKTEEAIREVPSRERDVLITAQSLRSHRKTRSSDSFDMSMADPSLALAKTATPRSKRAGRTEEKSPTAAIRVTRSKTDYSDPSIALAKGIPPSTRVTRSHGSPDSPRDTRAASQSTRRSRSPDMSEALKSPSVTGSIRSMRSIGGEEEEGRGEMSKQRLLKCLRTTLPSFVSLKMLRNSLGQGVDLMAVAAATPPSPHRPKNGPRDYMLEVVLTDPSLAPSGVTVAHIFRPHKTALPVIETGDVVLLRKFQIVSMKGRGFGVRAGDASAWAVFDNANDEMLPQIKGPPVEVVQEEVDYAAMLRKWWVGLDQKSVAKLDGAVKKASQAGKDEAK